MEWWHAIILGLVEGITEYLPISSTGHLIITSDLMGLDTDQNRGSLNAFKIVVQGGAILAVLGLYWARVEQMLLGLIGQSDEGRKLFINLMVAFFPALVLGALLEKTIEKYLFFTYPVAAAFIVGGIYMIILEQWRRRSVHAALPAAEADDPRRIAPEAPGKEIDELTVRESLIIGLLQCIAMWPGTSRSMMTITGGILMGLKPRAAAEFSFLLGMPTLTAAMCYKIVKDYAKSVTHNRPTMFENLGTIPVLLGIAVATVSAALAVKWLVSFLNRHGLTPFGIYRILLGIVLLGLVHQGLVDVTPKEAPEVIPALTGQPAKP